MGRVLVTVLAVAALAGCASGGRDAATGRPHIFLITSDTLRADHLSLHGYARETSPNLDAFAAGATHFTDAVTLIPKTGPSFATMFTGKHPQQHGVRSNFGGIPADLPVLAETLSELGYRTAAFVGNPALRETKGFARGFEHYELINGRKGEGVVSINTAFLKWADATTWDTPSFVWVHYMDPHGPYTPPAELEQLFVGDALAASDARVPPAPASVPSGNPNKVLGAVPAYQQIDGEDRVAVYIARYDAEIRHMDAVFGELLEYLDAQGLLDPAAVVFTSDHGESLGEHDFYFEHGWFAYEPTLHIPLIVKHPSQATGATVDHQVTILDLRPAILELAGAVSPVQGKGVLQSAASASAAALIENSDHYPDKYHGVRTGSWKYLRRERDGAEELYDLRADRPERRNLAADRPERLAELRAACDDALRRVRATALAPSTGLPDDPETLERLKSLGYVGD